MAKIEKVSPLAPASFPHIPSIKGVNFSTASAGVKYQGRSDVMAVSYTHLTLPTILLV